MAPSSHQKHQAGARLAVAETLLHETSYVRGYVKGTRSSWASVGGVRLRNPDSRHTAIYPANVEAWRNRWSLFEDVAQPVTEDTAS